MEEISRAWISAAGAVNSHSTVAHAIVRHGTEAQRAEWLPRMATGGCRAALALTEPQGGSDLRALRTTAVRLPDGRWRLSGEKRFITNGRRAGLVLVMARLETGGFGAFLAPQPSPGMTATSDWDKLGFRGIETCDLVLDSLLLPADALLGGQPEQGWAQVMDALDAGRLGVAASALGLARAALDDAVAYAGGREVGGRPLAQHPTVQMHLGQLATALNAARLLTLAAAADKDRRGESGSGSVMAKVLASQTAQDAALFCLRLHGGYGYTREYRAERYYRDAPAYLVGEGANDLLFTLVGKRIAAAPMGGKTAS